jgi:hypothetical protein
LTAHWQLSLAFPQLPWAPEADLFFSKVVSNELSIIEQLLERRIRRIEPRVMAGSGHIAIKNDAFNVLISVLYPPVHQMYTLGHEIGHTFHLDCEAKDPFHRFSHIVTKDCRNPDVEDFCEAFGLKWVDLHQFQDLRELTALFSRGVPINLSSLRCIRGLDYSAALPF